MEPGRSLFVLLNASIHNYMIKRRGESFWGSELLLPGFIYHRRAHAGLCVSDNSADYLKHFIFCSPVRPTPSHPSNIYALNCAFHKVSIVAER